MPRNLGAVEAANEIRNDVFNMPGVDPEEQHHIRFIQSVCSQLGLDHSPENMHKVAAVLHKHDIGMHRGHEYPKYAVRGYDKARTVVHNEEEEKAWVEATQPEPVEVLGPIVEEIPAQQQGLDLTKQVPEAPHDAEHPAGRAPDEVTNHAAAQGVDGDDVHFEEVDDDVHFEEVDGDADRDGEPGQDKDSTHDSVLGTEEPKHKSGDSSAGKTDKARRPVGNRRPL